MHEDLAPNIWINSGEDLNGNGIIDPADEDSIDTDGNGFIDDFWGWDWINLDSSQVWPGEDPGPPDNDPNDFDGHGTHCAGDACGASDNIIGIASPGFNCQIMSLRAGYLSPSGQGYVDLYAAFQAVYYAIDMGAEVLSMSFGGGSAGFFSTALQDADNAGLVLVAAAGNDSSPNIQYPAGYPFVIAVAATAEGDYLADFTNYGTWITLCAPGDAILSTQPTGYGNMGGTSMATPIVAGACAMVKSLMPEWDSNEVGDWLAQSADNIDAQNPSYIGMMGGGRLNLANAVDLFVTIDSVWTNPESPTPRINYNQQTELYVRYHKYYSLALDVTLEISCDNPRVSITQNFHDVGWLWTGDSGDNSENPFVLTVQKGDDEYEVIEINATFTGSDFEYTQVLRISAGRGQVLIIDADQNNGIRTASYYEDVMTTMGYSYETWKRANIETLDDGLGNYDVIIHFSGTAETDIFPPGDWDFMEVYLDNGGNMIVSGQNVAQDLAVSDPNTLWGTLKVTFLEEHSQDLSIEGTPGNPLSEDMYFVMVGAGGAWNQNSMDVVQVFLNSQSYFVYNAEVPERVAGVRVQDGQGDLFYCAFGIEAINDESPTGNTKLETIQMMFDQFGVTRIGSENPEYHPVKLTLYPPYPNPFNRNIKISYELPSASPVHIKIFDILGREVVNHYIHNAASGPSEWLWKTPASLSSGVYFISLETEKDNALAKIVFVK